MARVYYSTVVSAPIEIVWSLVRDFNGLPHWLPGVASSEIEEGCDADCTTCVGSVRRLVMEDGRQMREQLLSLSDLDASLSYSIIESELKIDDYVSTMTLYPVASTDETFVEWEAEFDCTDPDAEEATMDAVFDLFSAGLENLDDILYDADACCECDEGECDCSAGSCDEPKETDPHAEGRCCGHSSPRKDHDDEPKETDPHAEGRHPKK